MQYSDLFTPRMITVTCILLLLLAFAWFKPKNSGHDVVIGWPYPAIVRGEAKVAELRGGTRAYFGDFEINGTHVFWKYLGSDLLTASVVLLLGGVVTQKLTGRPR
jgi:hypothetical protein